MKVSRLGRKKGKGKKERKESAAADLQQAGVSAGAGLPTGQEMALIFRCQGTYKQRQQRQEKDGGNFKEGHGREVVESAAGSLRRRWMKYGPHCPPGRRFLCHLPNRHTVPRLAPVCMVGTFPGIDAAGDHTNRKTKRAQARNTMVWPIAPILSHFAIIARFNAIGIWATTAV